MDVPLNIEKRVGLYELALGVFCAREVGVKLNFTARTFMKLFPKLGVRRTTKKMNKKIGLLVGVLGLLLVSTASAGTESFFCGTVGSASGSVNFTTSSGVLSGPGEAGDASTSGGVGTITCNGFTVPPLQTLIGLTVTVGDAAQDALNASSVVTQTWTYSGEPVTPTPAGTDSETSQGGTGMFITFNPCVGGTGNLLCNQPYTFTPVTQYNGGQTTGGFSFIVTPSVTAGGGAGVSLSGTDSAEVSITFTYVPTSSIPEPTSLVLIGSGLIGLGVFARRKRRS